MRSHLMKITKEQDKFEETKIWICNYIIKIRTPCLLLLRALNHSLLFAYLFKGLGIDSLTLKLVLLYLINYISGARNVLVISYRSEGMGRREQGKEGRMGGRDRGRMRGRKKENLTFTTLPFSSPSTSTATMKTKFAVSTTASMGS